MSMKPPADHGFELAWIKSSYSTDDGPACVEVASTPTTIHIRDSKHRQGPQLAFGPQHWAAFVSYAVNH
ncbi:DUF397 domain-containing protein [Streptomyces enissocaesilis]|uniref:DUF397 domain-containing protein n=2 Tax=Streptomyces rochei TaxID=1928 RepID=UPI000A3975F1|nr:DUF397 domain-containing protein [Streptomyces rochei]WDI21065.1 DUF397 domain-containing protein [Streptomyces enissocaesilis]